MPSYTPLYSFTIFLACILTICNGVGAQSILTSRVNNSKEVPVLCYHQIRNHTASDGSAAKAYTVTPKNFAAHMQMLSYSGFHAILPDELYQYYLQGKALPAKPVIITFDDNTASQFYNALPVLNKHAFKAVFFVMTVSLNKRNYMSTAQLKMLHQSGHIIGSHSWDHSNVKTYTDPDWKQQLDKPMNTLQSATGSPVEYFAYPYGSWSPQAIEELQKRNIKMAFILHTKRDESKPLFTIRRLLVAGSWSANVLASQMQQTFAPIQQQ